MKKTIAISAVLVLALGLAGCQTPAQPEVKVPDKEAATESTALDQTASLEVTDEEGLEQQASLTITEPTNEDVTQQEATLTISEEGAADAANAQQEASLTISE